MYHNFKIIFTFKRHIIIYIIYIADFLSQILSLHNHGDFIFIIKRKIDVSIDILRLEVPFHPFQDYN